MEENQQLAPQEHEFDNPYYEHPTVVIYAGFWARFFAYMIDGLIIIVPILLLRYFVSGNVTGDQNGLEMLLEIVLTWLYFALQESGPKQATFGKRVLEIKVTDIEGRRINFGKATGRYFAKILSGMIILIGYIMAGFTSRKQALHDIIAETLVVTNNSF